MRTQRVIVSVCAVIAVICGSAPAVHGQACVVFCDGSWSGACPGGVGCPATPEGCLADICRNPVSCGCGSLTDCTFDGVSVLPPPVCGDGRREGNERCDPGVDPGGFGEQDCACPGECQANCICPGTEVRAFTYQGELLDGGTPVGSPTQTCDFEFTLWNAEVGGTQIGPALTPAVTVDDGRFTVTLDFGDDLFTGAPRWLQIQVCCPSGCAPAYTPLDPRQELTPAPYALALPGLRTTVGPGGGRLNVIGGSANTVGAGVGDATIGGGSANSVMQNQATVGGGKFNDAIGIASTVGGGSSNTASGSSATVPGGWQNIAGGDRSFAAGFNARVRTAEEVVADEGGTDTDGDEGTFVWCDVNGNTGDRCRSTGPNQFLILADGGVGIGTNAPLAAAHVEQQDLSLSSAALLNEDLILEDADAVLGLYSNNSGAFGSTISLAEVDAAGNLVDKWAITRNDTGAGSKLLFTYGTDASYAANPTMMILRPDGNVGIGTNAPGSPLEVHNDSTAGSVKAVHGLITSTSPGGFSTAVRGENKGTGGSGIGVWGSQDGSGWGVAGSAAAGGCDFRALGAGVDYCASSSIRWKRNVRNIDRPLEKVARLRGVYFDWNGEHGGHHDVGMIAEEVGKVLPEIVNYEENGVDASGMDYSKLTPLLIEAIKQMQTEHEAQGAQHKKKIDELRERIGALEGAATPSAVRAGLPFVLVGLIGFMAIGRVRKGGSK